MELASEQQADSALSFLHAQVLVELEASILMSDMEVDLSSRIDKFRYEKGNQHIDRCQYDPLHPYLEGRNLGMLESLVRNEAGDGRGHKKYHRRCQIDRLGSAHEIVTGDLAQIPQSRSRVCNGSD